jgi:hypothetical protein
MSGVDEQQIARIEGGQLAHINILDPTSDKANRSVRSGAREKASRVRIDTNDLWLVARNFGGMQDDRGGHSRANLDDPSGQVASDECE